MIIIQEARLNRSYLQRWVSVPFPPTEWMFVKAWCLFCYWTINHGTMPDDEYLRQKRFKLNVLTHVWDDQLGKGGIVLCNANSQVYGRITVPSSRGDWDCSKWSPWKNYTHRANLQPAASRAATIIFLPGGKPQVTCELVKYCSAWVLMRLNM